MTPFDPEKVKRYQPWIETGITDTIIEAEDYDKLLLLYREAKEELSFHSDKGALR